LKQEIRELLDNQNLSTEAQIKKNKEDIEQKNQEALLKIKKLQYFNV